MQAKQILIADDDEHVREILTRYVSKLSFVVHSTRDGAEALRFMLADERAVHGVFLDVEMPVMDGYACFQQLREFASTPIVFSTSKSEQEIRERVDWDQNTLHLCKPFGLSQLETAVTWIKSRSRA